MVTNASVKFVHVHECDLGMQDEQRDLAKTIRVSGSILLSTVSNFLDFFKMEAGKSLDVVRTEVDLEVRPHQDFPDASFLSRASCVVHAVLAEWHISPRSSAVLAESYTSMRELA